MSILNHLFNRKEQVKAGVSVQSETATFNTEREKDLTGKATELLQEDQEEKETYEVLEREIHPAKIICPDCGGITLEGFEFCDKCGGELL